MPIIKHTFELHKIPFKLIKNAIQNCWLGLITPNTQYELFEALPTISWKPVLAILYTTLTTKVTHLREQHPKYSKITIISNHNLWNNVVCQLLFTMLMSSQRPI